MTPRKTLMLRETITSDAMGAPCQPVTRVAALAVFSNPYAGQHVDDLSDLFRIGGDLGLALSSALAADLPAPAVSYGKAAIVGVNGDLEHGGAVIHPRLGAPMRAAIGGGQAVIPSNVKIGGPGTIIDVPLGHKDNVWSFDHFDTLSVMAGDAPRPDEIVLIIALADGGRPLPRCGAGPVTS